MNVLIKNETRLSLEHIGYILDNMKEIERHLGETIMYHSDSGISIALVITRVQYPEYVEWTFKGAAN